ncbi:hypothetical protein MLD38_027042 [Melastoma candidum]|uniref:Uncharacterized protein n=1 Tax=Melastoma candidum TaxID=119954 RepID=A0ACB9P6N0_9MYRT|nr:hypothetical protein MLD38_027042 [Melastoma candidum]
MEFRSPRDVDGQGTYKIVTAACCHSFHDSMVGYAAGVTKGGCCFQGNDCRLHGGGHGVSSPYSLDPIAISAYGVGSKGIFAASSVRE